MVEKIQWLKDLAKAEEQMEDSGLVDISIGQDLDRAMARETLQFLLQMKTEFIDFATAYNELKKSPLGRVKVYGIARTHGDFMLFRNGFKMIFSLKAPGQITAKFQFMGSQWVPQTGESANQGTELMAEQMLEAKWGAFQDVSWTFQNQPIRLESMVRFYFLRFIRESAK